MKHKKYLPVMATVSAVILLAGCRGIKDTGDKESIMEKSRLLAAEDTTVESTQVMTEMETQEETTEEITIIEKKPEEVTEELLHHLSEYCDEFLIHAVDVEGKASGIETELVELLAKMKDFPVTYAGGVGSFEDLELLKKLGNNHVDVTIGSALDLFGGKMKFEDVLAVCRR